MTDESGTSSIAEQRVRYGSLTVDLLGDFSRTGGREIRLKTLVELGEQLGIPGPTMRVTISRLRERGWFDVRRDGRESIYRLSPACVSALHEGGQRIHRPAPEKWGGEWSMVIYTVPESDRQTRDDLRKKLVWLGFGPLAPATWIRPRPQLDDLSSATVGLVTARLTLMTTRTSGPAEDRALVARCWDLESLGADYDAFATELSAAMASFRLASRDPRRALVARVKLVHAYRMFATRDPQLPVDLQPDGWHGDEARRLFEEAHAMLSAGSAQFYRSLDTDVLVPSR